MSFSVQKKVTPVKTYPSLLGAAIRGKEEKITVTYTVTSIVSLTDKIAVAEYSVSPEGASLCGVGNFEFLYSGSGNPLEEAEEALKDSLVL